MEENRFVEFGSRLKALREERGINQGRFADAIGITRQSMSNYESGKHSPDMLVLKKMIAYFGCSSDYLLGLTEYRSYEEQQCHTEDINRLSKALIALGHPCRELWLDTFLGITECIGRDVAMDSQFHFETQIFYGLFMKLIGHCLDTKERHQHGEYSAKDARAANDKLHAILQQLRAEVNQVDDISYMYINAPLHETGDEQEV